MREFLLDGGDASRIFASDHVFDLPRQHQILFGNNLSVFDHIYGDVVVDKRQHIQIQHINVTFHLENILFSHFITSGIFDDGYRAVQLIKLQVMVDR